MNKDSALSTKVGINCRIGHQMASKANLDRQSVLTTDTVYEIHPTFNELANAANAEHICMQAMFSCAIDTLRY